MTKNKSLLVLLLLFLMGNIFALDSAQISFQKAGKKVNLTITENYTLRAVADSISMPVKKLKAMLTPELAEYSQTHPEYEHYKTQNRNWDRITLKELDIEPSVIVEKFDTFVGNTLNFGGSITLVGTMVVFFSLLLISFIIEQLRHLDKAKSVKVSKSDKKKTETTTVDSPIGQITAPSGAISSNAIVAVITAIHRHKSLVEERVKIQMTFSRTPVNMWSASSKLDMPNKIYNKSIERNK